MVCGSSDGKDKKKRAQRAHGGKGGDKGLRHFSMKVCEKVEQKGRTTYNEVADELVAEFVNAGIVGSGDGEDGEVQYDEKNIRRRVYDALNVLMAMDIITKEKKQIQWRGLPTNTQQEEARMHMELASREDRLNKKRLHLQELLTQQISFKNLIKRNKTSAGSSNGGTNGTAAAGASSSSDAAAADRIPLPFIIVNSGKETVIDCEMAEDKQEIFFNFSVRSSLNPPVAPSRRATDSSSFSTPDPVPSSPAAVPQPPCTTDVPMLPPPVLSPHFCRAPAQAPFEIHDDNETLKRMRMQFCPVLSDIASMVPASLVQFTTTWQEQQQEIETRAGRPIPGSEAASWAVRPATASS